MKAITEEMGVHKAWYDVRPKNVEELTAFLKTLINDYQHDYGTIVHAVTAAALAAARTVNADASHGGITGFQASCVMWSFISKWMSYPDGPMRLVETRDMLYPQNADSFRTISLETFRWLQTQAQSLIAKEEAGNERPAHPDVVAHWRLIASGEVPFGYRIKD